MEHTIEQIRDRAKTGLKMAVFCIARQISLMRNAICEFVAIGVI